MTKIKNYDPHFICLQEIRQEIRSSPNYHFINKLRNVHRQGGGICIGIHKQFICRDISHLLALDSLEYLIVQCVNRKIEIFLINIYSPNAKYFKQQQFKIQNFITQLLIKKPRALIILTGGINNGKVKIQGLIDVIPNNQMTYQRKFKNATRQSKTDIFFINPQMDFLVSFDKNDLSDHMLVYCQLQVNRNCKNKRDFSFNINKEQVYQLNVYCQKSLTFDEFWGMVNREQWRFQIYRRKRLGLEAIKHRTQSDFQAIFQSIRDTLRSENSKLAHILINKLILVNPNKREGGIMNCYINEEDELITDQKLVQTNVVNTIGQYSGLMQFQPMELPELEPITFDQFKYMKARISQNKALTSVLISDSWISKNGSYLILNNVWNKNTQRLIPNFAEFQIVPLNKNYPNIPKKNDFRPITILSPLYKWMELRFEQKFKDYCNSQIIKQQIGFISGFGTRVQILRLIKDIQKVKAKDNHLVLFIDFKSAYNTHQEQVIRSSHSVQLIQRLPLQST